MQIKVDLACRTDGIDSEMLEIGANFQETAMGARCLQSFERTCWLFVHGNMYPVA